jgi:hypothetical protein
MNDDMGWWSITMDTTALLAAFPVRAEEALCILFEAGAQPESSFLAFKDRHEGRLHSPYIHRS